ncbi:MAG: hypothetical protein ACFE7R_11995, partial [Candidatus Hodarchaeota archaeon]
VQDTTEPSWIVRPSDQAIDEGEALHVQFSAEDLSGIDTWWVNDTTNFHIDNTGLLTNNTVLPMGDYGLRVSVNDTYGNVNDYEIRIRILFVPPVTTTTTTTTTTATTTTTTTTTTPTSPTPTIPVDFDFLVLVLGGIGAVILIVVIVVIMKRRPAT